MIVLGNLNNHGTGIKLKEKYGRGLFQWSGRDTNQLLRFVWTNDGSTGIRAARSIVPPDWICLS